MIVPSRNMRGVRARRFPVFRLLALLLVLACLWCAWVLMQIDRTGSRDQAQKADAIAVFGAAEYQGKPSPVLRARLDHALELYQRGIAPVIITTGGQGDMQHSEGGVGRDYLVQHGVPLESIIAETLSASTQEAVEQLAAIARSHNFRTIVVVSDATHMFRIAAMSRAAGLTVYTSPRPPKNVSWAERIRREVHEVTSYTAWRLHLSGAYDE